MKQNSIEHLLEKYREGALTDEERVELEALTHKDEVMTAAAHRARGIARRRVSLAVGVVAILGVGVAFMVPKEQGPLIAKASQAVVAPAPAVDVNAPLAETETLEMAPVQKPVSKPIVAPKPQAVRPASQAPTVVKKASAEPVVVCNSQCDADSVISDIRKFLSV